MSYRDPYSLLPSAGGDVDRLVERRRFVLEHADQLVRRPSLLGRIRARFARRTRDGRRTAGRSTPLPVPGTR